MHLEPVIKNKFENFRKSFGLTNISDGLAFERFVNHTVLKAHQPDAFGADSQLLDKVCVGGSNDTGIDGAVVKLNGILIKSIDDANDILNKYRKANIEFIFIQSKYRPFNAEGLNSFIAGVRDFLSNDPNLPVNPEVKELRDIKDFLLSDDVVNRVMWDENPSVRMYYVAMGRWKEEKFKLQVALALRAKKDILALNIYGKVDLHFVDSEALNKTYESNENTFETQISTEGTLPLTEVDGVQNSCIAVCYANEFCKLLMTDEGVIRKSLFEDNVRDFQGINNVNTEIEETIEHDPAKFILLNNGITVVCKNFDLIGKKIKIKNPQIVNGCQTSHVLFYAQKKGLDISTVPINVKFVATENLEISNQIVRGTNRQNNVLDEAFETTKKFHKDLQDFFDAFSGDYERLYYERRSKEYSHLPQIKQTQKINLRILTQYFVGMFLDKPEVSHRHESILLKDFANTLYQEFHSKTAYYATGLAFFRLEELCREGKIQKDILPYNAHLLMMLREKVAGACPNLNFETGIDEHSQKLINALKSKTDAEKLFIELSKLLDKCRKYWIDVLKRNQFGIKDVPEFTELLLNEVRKVYSIKVTQLSTNEDFIYKGTVMNTRLDKFGNWCGFIHRPPDNIFFHSNFNRKLDFNNLTTKLVSYKIKINQTDNRPFAIDIQEVK
jgi:hypothetical protein